MTLEERALQVWQVLIGAAHHRHTMTYQDLGDAVGLSAHAVGRYLYIIKDYCTAKGLPPLTVLVVQKSTGLPGSGAGEVDAAADQEAVYAHAWYSRLPLATEKLAPYTKRRRAK